jgi:hypothetical protein
MKTFPQTVEPDQALADLPIERLLDRTIAIKATQKRLDGDLADLQEELTRRVDTGDLDPTFAHNDWGFILRGGKPSWSYPAPIKASEASLKAAKKAAEADGTATKTTGAPFWSIRSPQP